MNNLKRFRIRLFDRIEWEWREFDVIAEDSEDVMEYMNKRLNPEFRQRPYTRTEEDSLTVELVESVDLPIIKEC